MPAWLCSKASHIRQLWEAGLGVFRVYDALIPAGHEAVEDCEHRTKAHEMVLCEVGDGCGAIRCIVLGVIPTSTR